MSAEFCTTQLRTAAKPHRCEECWRTISKGETYQHAVGKWEGDFWAMKTCAHCAAFREIADAYDDYYYSEGAFGGLDTWVSDGGWDATYDRRTPWVRRMALFRQLRNFRNGWRESDGTLAPIPDPRWLVADRTHVRYSIQQIINRFFPEEPSHEPH